MKTYKITVVLENVVMHNDNEESVKESVKAALNDAIQMDDDGDEELIFTVEEEEDEECF